jgi:hypothetical protein
MRATIDRQSAALAATLPAASENGGAVAAGSWPSERHPLGYGDAPFNPARLAQLSNWLGALEKRGFVGSAHIAVSIADYCLTGNPGEGIRWPLLRCRPPAVTYAAVLLTRGVRRRSANRQRCQRSWRVFPSARTGDQGGSRVPKGVWLSRGGCECGPMERGCREGSLR